MLTAQWRGYLELERAGVIERRPRMIAVQSFAAPPLLEAFRAGKDHVPTLPSATSAISGINVPFCGDHALAAVYDSEGLVSGVHDEEVLVMQRSTGSGRRHMGRTGWSGGGPLAYDAWWSRGSWHQTSRWSASSAAPVSKIRIWPPTWPRLPDGNRPRRSTPERLQICYNVLA